MYKHKKRFVGLILVSLFVGSLFLGLGFESNPVNREERGSFFENKTTFEALGPSQTPQTPQSEFSILGQNETEALLSYQGAAILNSNSIDGIEIASNNWNTSDILVNFTDIHRYAPPIIVEDQTLGIGFATIFNTSGAMPKGVFAMQFRIPDYAFIFKLSVYLRYAGNFSMNAKIYSAMKGVTPTRPSSLDSGCVATSITKNLSTNGPGEKTEWVEFEFDPRNLKAYLDIYATENESFFVVLTTEEFQDVGGDAYLQWGYLKDSLNGDSGTAWMWSGNTWQLIQYETSTVDFLLTNITISTRTFQALFDVEASSKDDFVLVYEESLIGEGTTQTNAQQFTIDTMSYLTQLEVYLNYRGQVNVYADIFNATESTMSNPGEPIPHLLQFSSKPTSLSTLFSETEEWVTIQFPEALTDNSTFLDLQNTFNNTFFVVLRGEGAGGVSVRPLVEWGYRNDGSSGDDGYAYYLQGDFGVEDWILYEFHPEVLQNIDLLLKNIEIVSYEENPSEVNLYVNGSEVTDYTAYSFGGSVILSGPFNGFTGYIVLEIESDPEVHFLAMWSTLFINQTRANTYFKAKSLTLTVNWNVTLFTNFPKWNFSTGVRGLYYDREINITLPKGYLINRVYYMGINLLQNIFWRAVQGVQSQTLIIRNFSIFFPAHGYAGSWLIQATSSNFIQELKTYNGTEQVNQFYVWDEMNVSARLAQQTTVAVNLSIYDQYKQVTNTSLSVPTGLWVNFPLWNITENSTHHVVVYWSNGTEVGIKSLSLECVYHTNLSMVYTNIGPGSFKPTDNIYIDVFYNDTDNNAGIPNAIINVNVSFTVIKDSTPGFYNITLQPFLLENGNYTARIDAFKSGYNLSTIYVNFSVFSTSIANLSAVDGVRSDADKLWINPDPYFDDQTHILTVLYRNGSFPYEGIEYAQIIADPNWTTTNWFGSPTNLTPGFYDVIIDTEGLHEGDVGRIKITAYSGQFETKIIWIYVNITEIPSSLLNIDAGDYSNITAYEGETIEIAIGYWDAFHGNPILFENATVGNITWNILGTGANGTLTKSVWQYEDSISLPAWNILGTKTYQVLITATAAQDYATTQANLTLNVLSKENTTLTLTNWTATEYRVGNSFTVFANLLYENGTALINKRIDLNITLWNKTGSVIDSFVDSRNTNLTGFAIYEFPTIAPGISQISVNATYEGTEKIDPAADLLIIPIKPKYNVTLTLLSQLPSEIMVGNPLQLEAQLLNNETLLGIANATIQFILFSGQAILVDRKATTDGNGHVLIEIEITSAMAEYETFRVRIIFTGSPTSNPEETLSTTSVGILTVEKLVLRYLPYVAIVAVAVVATFVSYRQFVAVPRRRRRLARMEKLAAKFTDIINLQHILVLHSASGSCIFQHSFGETTFDADLISGFLTAISAFQTELVVPAAKKIPFEEPHHEKEGEKGFELSYANFKILLKDGIKIRTALILATPPTDSIRGSLDDFVKLFETKFTKALREWRGAMEPFRKASELVETAFETSLLWPHRIETFEKEVVKELSSLESSLFTIALEIQTDKRYFFLPALVAKAESIRRETQVEILGTIDDLRHKGIFKAVPIDRLEEQLKEEANNQQSAPSS